MKLHIYCEENEDGKEITNFDIAKEIMRLVNSQNTFYNLELLNAEVIANMILMEINFSKDALKRESERYRSE